MGGKNPPDHVLINRYSESQLHLFGNTIYTFPRRLSTLYQVEGLR